MQANHIFDQASFERFLEANKHKDFDAISQYLHQDCTVTFNRHVFNRKSYLWFLKLTYPLIDFELTIKDLILLEKTITCKLFVDVKVLQNGHHMMVGRLLKSQYWQGCIPVSYELKHGKICAITLQTGALQPLSPAW